MLHFINKCILFLYKMRTLLIITGFLISGSYPQFIIYVNNYMLIE